MSYATIRDVLFALDLTDSELRDRMTTEPELPEDRSDFRSPSALGLTRKGSARIVSRSC
jgi:hypothetical protein